MIAGMTGRTLHAFTAIAIVAIGSTSAGTRATSTTGAGISAAIGTDPVFGDVVPHRASR